MDRRSSFSFTILAVAFLLVACFITPSSSESGALTQPLASAFDKVDSNHDGSIDRTEFSVLEKSDNSIGIFSGISSKINEKTSKVGFTSAFANGITMIIATEIGDKTFWLAALMAMRYNRLFVFAGSIGALIVMTILSVFIGVAVPALLPKQYTHYAAAALFAYFGMKLLREASTMEAGQANEELQEAEEQLADVGLVAKEDKDKDDQEEHLMEDGSSNSNNKKSSSNSSNNGGGDSAMAPRLDSNSGNNSPNNNSTNATNGSSSLASSSSSLPPSFLTGVIALLGKDWIILTQAFTMTFLAEWGDRSQIATIAMAAAQDPWGVCLGGLIGHSLCTGLAVMGGRLLAARISERMVAYMGGALFVIFALHSVIAGPEVDE